MSSYLNVENRGRRVSNAYVAYRRLYNRVSSGGSVTTADPILDYPYDGLAAVSFWGLISPEDRDTVAEFADEFVEAITGSVGTLTPDDLHELRFRSRLEHLLEFVRYGFGVPSLWVILYQYVDFAALARITDYVHGAGSFRELCSKLRETRAFWDESSLNSSIRKALGERLLLAEAGSSVARGESSEGSGHGMAPV